jgi:NAD(P)-dependent dehydrogenase (short-subunit alcohol dehydrogenase family)
MSSTKPLAIIYGVGPGLGLSLAKAFSSTHSLAIMSRSLSNLQPFVDELTKSGAEVKAFASEATEEGLTSAFAKIKKDFGGREVSVGVWNGSFRSARAQQGR